MADDLTDAWKLLSGKESFPSDMLTADWQRAPQWLRERHFFMAGVNKAAILEEFRGHAADIVQGKSNIPEATRRIQAFLDGAGYVPNPGEEGTIKDLRSGRRIAVTLSTNIKLLQGWAKKERGLRGGAARAFPAWELVRIDAREVPREWHERFVEAGGELTQDGRMIALKTSDVWKKLGTIFDDSIGVDYPPFAWNSGMGWRAVSRREAKALGLLDAVEEQEPQPVSSPNATLETTVEASPEVKAALTDHLKGLAEFQGDVLVFTDPNGTRQYSSDKLAQVVTAPLPAGFPQVQAQAVERHVNAGLMLGDLKDDFVRFAARTLPLESGEPVYRGEAYRSGKALRERLADLDAGTPVTEVAQSWTLNSQAAEAFASGRGMRHRLILETRSHGSLRPIWPTVELLVPSAEGQKEVVALNGTRFRTVRRREIRRSGRVVEVRLEVEEVAP